MDISKLFRERFFVIAGGLMSASAYFFAAGASALVGSAIASDSPPRRFRARAPSKQVGVRATHSARPILERNPFDSVKGPLTEDPTDLTASAPARRKLGDPLAVPECSGVQVYATTESDDPLWSLAMVQAQGEPKGHLRRVGDHIADKTLAYIGYNPRIASPAVWFETAEGVCQTALFSDEPRHPKPKPKLKKPPTRKPVRRGRGTPVPPDLIKKIQRVSDTEFNIDRSAIDVVMEGYSKLMRGTKVIPVQKDGKVVGLRIPRIPNGSLLGVLGIKNNDRIDKINGFSLSSPEKALQAYARLRTASNLSVQIVRNGKPTTIDYHIR